MRSEEKVGRFRRKEEERLLKRMEALRRKGDARLLRMMED